MIRRASNLRKEQSPLTENPKKVELHHLPDLTVLKTKQRRTILSNQRRKRILHRVFHRIWNGLTPTSFPHSKQMVRTQSSYFAQHENNSSYSSLLSDDDTTKDNIVKAQIGKESLGCGSPNLERNDSNFFPAFENGKENAVTVFSYDVNRILLIVNSFI